MCIPQAPVRILIQEASSCPFKKHFSSRKVCLQSSLSLPTSAVSAQCGAGHLQTVLVRQELGLGNHRAPWSSQIDWTPCSSLSLFTFTADMVPPEVVSEPFNPPRDLEAPAKAAEVTARGLVQLI